jgi:catechol 2,3-dioxygenase-like lactoylglutathione lyase family enzyme
MTDQTSAPVSVAAIDHVVLNVADGERAMCWYRDRLGLEPLRYDEWKAGEVPFLSLRVNQTTIIDLFVADRTGENMDHVSFCVEGDIDALLEADDVEVEVERPSVFGAQGDGPAVYVRDPDGNLVELKRYPNR